jgi:hypothetical protein
MNNSSRWDLAARYVAMLLLLAICMTAIGAIEILFIGRSSGNGWH